MNKNIAGQYKWTTLDIVMVAVIGVVFAILYWAYNQLFAFLFPFISASPITIQAFVGFWFIAGIVSGYIIQKPGAAFLGERSLPPLYQCFWAAYGESGYLYQD